MNTTSKPRGIFWFSASKVAQAAAVAALTLGACIQGPWDYYPDNPPPFHGLFLTGYAVAGQPLRHVCFERVLDISEEATEAYAFYDTAGVRVGGRFGKAGDTTGAGIDTVLRLTASLDTPNCFLGDPNYLVKAGSNYGMDARIRWDSAGQKVLSHLTGTAHVPTKFKLHHDAVAPSLAKTGGVPADIFSVGFFLTLPPAVRDVMVKAYGDTLSKLLSDPTATQNDSAALKEYIRMNGRAIQSRLTDLLKKDHYTYQEYDTVFYLNGTFNTLSHYYSDDRSPDVKAVLITQRFDPNGQSPQTAFDSPLGTKPDSAQFYFPGDIRRLLVYPDAVGPNGWNVLDSMGVVNTWFQTGLNRLYFYATEQAYYDFQATATATQGGGGQNGDPRVKVKYNVTGGQGVFVGALPDSFDLVVKVDSMNKPYDFKATHAAYCRGEPGWQGNADCRAYYPVYCEAQGWRPAECRPASVNACLEAPHSKDTTLHLACDASVYPSAADTATLHQGQRLYCVANNFPDSEPACGGIRAECRDTKGQNACKQSLWNYCLDNSWQPEACQWGLVSYCTDKPRLSETLCGHADSYCRDHPTETLCR